MTYCVAINVNEGLVFAADSRTNAGIDHVSSYPKLHTFHFPGERIFVLLSAGNLATTQKVIKRLGAEGAPNLGTVATMHQAAELVGHFSTEIQQQHARDTANTSFEATFILGGQIAGQPPELFLIYPQGNFIHEPPARPFLQIGEIKYGKPILDRVIRPDTRIGTAARCALVSINSTVRSNVTVGPPIDLFILPMDAVDGGYRLHLTEEDPYYRELGERWNAGLLQLMENLPRFPWESY